MTSSEFPENVILKKYFYTYAYIPKAPGVKNNSFNCYNLLYYHFIA